MTLAHVSACKVPKRCMDCNLQEVIDHVFTTQHFSIHDPYQWLPGAAAIAAGASIVLGEEIEVSPPPNSLTACLVLYTVNWPQKRNFLDAFSLRPLL